MTEAIAHIIESLLFVSDTPLSVKRLAEVLETEDLDAVRGALRRLSDEYDRRQGGFYLSEVAGGYQLRTRPEHKEWIRRLLQSGPARLSKAAMETLAVIAYRQPVLRSDVEHIRGVDCGGVLRVLLERKIIKILGRKEMPGRPLLYGTTRKFLEMFNLRDLRDLPTPRELAKDHAGTTDAAAPNDGTDAPDGPPETAAGQAAGDAPPEKNT
ncbi:SMC-Scp complex subunit ScpB [Desulfococcus sp.]|uniref:SMC-Scp complex subunit ScpB n=1 Tax=Desulfococcus sp. TaxID=2025834 RepID=UPI0035930011